MLYFFVHFQLFVAQETLSGNICEDTFRSSVSITRDVEVHSCYCEDLHLSSPGPAHDTRLGGDHALAESVNT